MGLREKAWDVVKWKLMKSHLGYTDEEMRMFRENPRNEEVLSKAPELMNKTIVLEVVASHGCNSRHRVGDKLHFDGAGNLITKKCPEKVCVYADECGDSVDLRMQRTFPRGCRSEQNEVSPGRLY